MSVGVIDVGTNTVRLLITDGRGFGERDMIVTRLGEGVDAARVLGRDAMRRTTDAIAERVERCRARGIEHLRVVGTSAVRDAVNRDELRTMVRDAAGVALEVITGRAEASYAFLGATRAVEDPAPYLVCDIGGGSTELIVGSAAIERARSLDVGSVRLTERHLGTDPVEATERAAARADADAAIAASGEWPRAETLIGVAGTVTTLSAIIQGLERYDHERVHHAWITRQEVARAAHELAAMTLERRAAIPVMPPGRAEVIVAGVTIFEAVMDAFAAGGALVSETDLLDGLAAELLAAERAEPR